MIECVYLAGIVWFALVLGQRRKAEPKGFFFDLLSTILIFVWPIMFAYGLIAKRRKT